MMHILPACNDFRNNVGDCECAKQEGSLSLPCFPKRVALDVDVSRNSLASLTAAQTPLATSLLSIVLSPSSIHSHPYNISISQAWSSHHTRPGSTTDPLHLPTTAAKIPPSKSSLSFATAVKRWRKPTRNVDVGRAFGWCGYP